MLVRVKKEAGNYGLCCNGTVSPRNWGSGAFEVPDAQGRELISRGVAVEAAGEENAPAAEKNSLEKLREQARQRGLKGYARMSRSRLLDALASPEEDEAPTPNAMAAVD